MSLLPVATAAPSGDLTAYVGKAVQARGVRVLAVPAGEGFWVGTSESDRVWVQLGGVPGESPYKVAVGDKVDFAATVVAHGADFAAKVGVDAAEGAAMLTAAKAHIEVDKAGVSLSKG